MFSKKKFLLILIFFLWCSHKKENDVTLHREKTATVAAPDSIARDSTKRPAACRMNPPHDSVEGGTFSFAKKDSVVIGGNCDKIVNFYADSSNNLLKITERSGDCDLVEFSNEYSFDGSEMSYVHLTGGHGIMDYAGTGGGSYKGWTKYEEKIFVRSDAITSILRREVTRNGEEPVDISTVPFNDVTLSESLNSRLADLNTSVEELRKARVHD
jgi:hypothetical protein